MSVAVLLWSAEGHLLREDPLTSVAQVPPPLFIKILFYFLHDGLLLPGLIICSPVALVKVLQKPRNNIMWGGGRGWGWGRETEMERENLQFIIRNWLVQLQKGACPKICKASHHLETQESQGFSSSPSLKTRNQESCWCGFCLETSRSGLRKG